MKRPPSPHPDYAGLSPEAFAALLAHTPYRVVGFLGAGRWGAVWAIEHGFLKKRFALKILHAHLAAFADRMRVEAETMGRLTHPNVVHVVDFWVSSDGRPCIVMELLQGRTLGDELEERRRLPINEALAVTSQVLSALVATHALGVVHRDLKPENVFLHVARGYGLVVKVLDFGIARVLPSAHATGPTPATLRTVTGTMVGSPQFMSPEAWSGATLDARADVYSVGVMLYVMIAGRGPFDAGHSSPQPLSSFPEHGLSPELDAIVGRAIRDDPGARYQTATDFLAAIQPWLRASSTAPTGKR
ncbi:MAG TPA: serine/threonine-protein kinase [Polyangiaceae bacterium]|nr:serine/threonine-protein kinase [Polyangiaceae bacterium]